MLNEGKKFERDIKNSIPIGCYYYRLKDPAQSFGTNENLRFSQKNPYDSILYSYPLFYAIELKTTGTNAFSFWKDGLPEKGSYNIKKHQIEGLKKASETKGVMAGLILNFRSTERTYYISIENFCKLTSGINKKSINENDIKSYALLVEQKKLRTSYKYDLEKLITHIERNYSDLCSIS